MDTKMLARSCMVPSYSSSTVFFNVLLPWRRLRRRLEISLILKTRTGRVQIRLEDTANQNIPTGGRSNQIFARLATSLSDLSLVQHWRSIRKSSSGDKHYSVQLPALRSSHLKKDNLTFCKRGRIQLMWSQGSALCQSRCTTRTTSFDFRQSYSQRRRNRTIIADGDRNFWQQSDPGIDQSFAKWILPQCQTSCPVWVAVSGSSLLLGRCRWREVYFLEQAMYTRASRICMSKKNITLFWPRK
jgi:hypothetical protein